MRDFTSEFLHGCNMSFRRSAIVAIPDVPWLHGQSQGDDLYISLVAGQYGELLVSPALRAWHARPSGPSESRPARPDVIRAGVVSWYELLRLRHTSALRTVAFFWTITCFVLKDATRPRRAHLVPGYIQGTMDVIGARLRTTVAARSP